MTRVTVRVTPRAGRSEVTGWDGDILHVRVTVLPEDGKANAAVIALLARRLSVPKSTLSIVGGASSRTKIVDIGGMSPADMRAALQAGS